MNMRPEKTQAMTNRAGTARSARDLRWIALGALALLAPARAHGAGGDIRWTFQGIEDINVAAAIQDRTGDGVPDVAIETYDSGAPAGAHHLYLVDGASSGTPGVIWSVRPPGGASSGGGDGDQCMAIAPDMTGDGQEDILLGTAWGGRTAYLIDADNGNVVWDFDTYVDSPPAPAVSGWVYQILPVPDMTGDGVPEVAFGCGSDNNGAYLADGATGAILWYQPLADAVYSLTVVPHFTPDGKPAVVYGTGDNDGRLYCVTGRGPSGIAWIQDPGGTIYHCATIHDITGDGLDDVVEATWAGTVVAVNARTGAPVWTYVISAHEYGMRVAILDDVDGDGYQDVAVASWDNAAHLVSGRTGTRVWRSATGTLNGGDVWAIDRAGDLNGDGVNDVVAGSFDTRVWAFDGVNGDTLWTTPAGGHRVFTVRGAPDLTGNGVPDVLAGTQMLSGLGGQAYLIEGGEARTGVAAGPRGGAPAAIALDEVRPSPFRSETTIAFTVARADLDFDIEIYDAAGRAVRCLAPPSRGPGLHEVRWDGRDAHGAALPAGVYFVRAAAGGASEARRVVLLR